MGLTDCMCDVFRPQYNDPDSARSAWHSLRCPVHGARMTNEKTFAAGTSGRRTNLARRILARALS